MKKSQLKQLIREILSEEYPKNFSMEEFNKIPSYRGKIQYVQSLLQRISSGSSRIVYKIDDEKVLKLAKNKKGLAQNEVEGTPDYMRDSLGIFAKVFSVDENNFYWIEMELAKKVSKSRFKELTGFTIEEMDLLMRYLYARSKNRVVNLDPKLKERAFKEDSYYLNIEDFVANFNFNPMDFTRLNSFGEVSRDGEPTIVIIDYGLSNDVWATYYGK